MCNDRFSVEQISPSGNVGEYAIRYRPPERKKDDGSTSFGLSFHVLLAGDLLGDQENFLQTVADLLNASEVGK